MQTPSVNTFYDASSRIWRGPRQKMLYSPNMTIGEVALHILSLEPGKVIQIADEGEKRVELTADQLIENAHRVAKELMRMGIRPGDVVGLCANNTTNLVAVVLAAFLCGAPINALYPDFDKENIRNIFMVTQPKVIFCESGNYTVVEEVCTNLQLEAKLILMDIEKRLDTRNVTELLNARNDEEASENPSFPCFDLTGDDTAVILCSSGTTGPPKGVKCSHRALLNMNVFCHLKADSVLFCLSTLYWASGIFTLITSITQGVSRVITSRPFSPDYCLDLIQRYRITHYLTPPYHIAKLLEAQPINLRQRLACIDTILCGGSKVHDSIYEKMNEVLDDGQRRTGFAIAYGSSELAGMASAIGRTPEKRRKGTVGKLVPNREARIVDVERDLLVGPNQTGMLQLRTPYKWFGYHSNPEATAKCYTQDGWLVTGDLAFFDDDGFLHICGRDSDIFKSNNFQVNPGDIEGVIMKLPGVLEVCVFGWPDFLATNLIACAIVRTNDGIGRRLSGQAVVDHVKETLAEVFHLKGGVHFVQNLPKTSSGKIQRRKVLELINAVNSTNHN